MAQGYGNALRGELQRCVFLSLGGGIAAVLAMWRRPASLLTARAEWNAGLAAGAFPIVA